MIKELVIGAVVVGGGVVAYVAITKANATGDLAQSQLEKERNSIELLKQQLAAEKQRAEQQREAGLTAKVDSLTAFRNAMNTETPERRPYFAVCHACDKVWQKSKDIISKTWSTTPDPDEWDVIERIDGQTCEDYVEDNEGKIPCQEFGYAFE